MTTGTKTVESAGSRREDYWRLIPVLNVKETQALRGYKLKKMGKIKSMNSSSKVGNLLVQRHSRIGGDSTNKLPSG